MAGIDFVSAAEMAEKWHITKRRVTILCKEGRIPGAKIIGNIWVLPADAEKPEDPRRVRKQARRRS